MRESFDEDDGYIVLSLLGHEQRLDLYEQSAAIADIARESEGKPSGEFLRALADHFRGLGYPEVSLRLADKAAASIQARVRDLKNASGVGPTPGSQDSTGSTPGD